MEDVFSSLERQKVSGKPGLYVKTGKLPYKKLFEKPDSINGP